MKIYIAGSITNNPDYKEQFEKAEKALINKGYEVVNPTKNNENSYKNYIDAGLKQLMDCDEIYMLSGYENSKGAMLEKHYAEVAGLKVGENNESKTTNDRR